MVETHGVRLRPVPHIFGGVSPFRPSCGEHSRTSGEIFLKSIGLGRLIDANEILTNAAQNPVAHRHKYSYDSLSQLIDANISNINSGNWTADYDYEDNGNMLSRNQTSFTYSGNEMTSAGGSGLSYDENGNLKTDPTNASFVYNWDNKLQSASKGSTTISLKYDPSGNRIVKNSNTNGNRKYIVDTVGNLPVILLELEPQGNNQFEIKKAYVYANSQIVSQTDGTNKYYYLYDRLGSIRQIINAAGSVVKTYTYEPFGQTIEESGTVDNEFKFTGQYYDSEVSEYYLRARQYSPYISRFTSYDPVAGKFEIPLTFNKYLYCGNSPVIFVDPDGREIRLGWSKPPGLEYDKQTLYHTLLQIIPDNQAQYLTVGNSQYFNEDTAQIEFTIDAGPHSLWGLFGENGTYMEARLGGPNDKHYYPNNPTYDSYRLDLEGRNEDYIISKLLIGYENYKNRETQVMYTVAPQPQPWVVAYNSNSFTAGLLNYAGIKRRNCTPPVSVPGWDRYLPNSYFEGN